MSRVCCTIVVAVNDRQVLAQNLLRSPDLDGDHQHQVIVREGYPSASLAYNSGLDEAQNDLVVCVHQDVYFPEGWFARLATLVEQWRPSGAPWGVLGCFGSCRSVSGGVGRVYTSGKGWHGKAVTAPERIETLDEIVLVLRRSSGLRFDPALPAFHLYGTDICLAARSRGFENYALPGFCVHNTNQLLRLPPEFSECYRYLKRKWFRRMPIYTSCITISRFDREMRSRSIREFGSRMTGRQRLPMRRVSDPRTLLGNAGFD
jgi:hypothetical protein